MAAAGRSPPWSAPQWVWLSRGASRATRSAGCSSAGRCWCPWSASPSSIRCSTTRVPMGPSPARWRWSPRRPRSWWRPPPGWLSCCSPTGRSPPAGGAVWRWPSWPAARCSPSASSWTRPRRPGRGRCTFHWSGAPLASRAPACRAASLARAGLAAGWLVLAGWLVFVGRQAASFRHAAGLHRQQLKWLLAGAVSCVIATTVTIFWGGQSSGAARRGPGRCGPGRGGAAGGDRHRDLAVPPV